MNVSDTTPIDFASVMNVYKQYHGSKNDWWEVRNLERANEKFGLWMKARISISDVGGLVLPQYQHEGVNITPADGSLLEDAYTNFKSRYDYFLEGNSQFCERVNTQKMIILSEGFKPIFLSQEPLFVGTSYSGLHKFKGMLTHLDGFHRLMALRDLIEEKKNLPTHIDCYIAIYPENH
jgi:hypothetical protein